MFWWLEHIWHLFFPKKEIVRSNPILVIVYYINAVGTNSETIVRMVEGFSKQIQRWRLLQPEITIFDLIIASDENKIDIKMLSGSDQSDTETLKALRQYLQNELTINNAVEFFEA